MRLEEIKEGEEVSNRHLIDYFDCGNYYLHALYRNTNSAAFTLSQNTNLEDLQKKYGGYVCYSKYCRVTFRMYRSDNGTQESSRDPDEVVDWTKINAECSWVTARLLKSLITGNWSSVGNSTEGYVVRWPNQKGGRGTNWYRLAESKEVT